MNVFTTCISIEKSGLSAIMGEQKDIFVYVIHLPIF